MRHTYFPLIVLALSVLSSPNTGYGVGDIFVQHPKTYNGPDHIPGQIIVKFRSGVNEGVVAQINEKHNAKVAHRSPFADFRVLKFPESISPQTMVNLYAKNPNVEYVELNYIAHICDTPTDPGYTNQWHLDNVTYGGIGMEEAWDLSTGAGVTVAVIDTGVKLGGPDGVPASGGYDFVNKDADPTDDHGHGTHVAGTIAQNTNNGVGVAGVAYGCSILPVKVLDASGSGSYANIAEGIRFAADAGAQVINMSLSGALPSTTLESALAYAYNMGVTIVCSSGNKTGTSTQIGYPAAYDAYCIAVGATRYDETVASYSKGGSALDLSAPGGDTSVDQNGDGLVDGVLQETFYNGSWGYWLFQGTSMAAPHVSGVAALVISKGIASSPDAVRNILQSTAEDKGTPGWDSEYGWGIVDAYRALGGGTEPPAPTLTSITVSPESTSIEVGGTQQFTAIGTYSDGSTTDITSSVTWESSDTSVASINQSGLATGVGSSEEAAVSITATLGTIVGTAWLTVSPPVTLSSIAVTPESATIAVGSTQQFTAIGTYSDGSMMDITSSVTWESSDTSVASINQSGLATGLGGGTVSITATLGTIVGVAGLTVSPPVTLSSIAVTPESATIAVGGTQQFMAIGTYSDGSTMDITSSVTWESSNTSVASINQSGLATGIGGGTVSITVALEGIQDSVSLTVGRIFSASLSPMTFTYRKIGATYYVKATVLVRVLDQQNQGVDGATVTGRWSGATSNVASKTTRGGGYVTFVSKEVRTRKPVNFTLTIDNITKSGWTYDNKDPSVTGTWYLPGSKSFGF